MGGAKEVKKAGTRKRCCAAAGRGIVWMEHPLLPRMPTHFHLGRLVLGFVAAGVAAAGAAEQSPLNVVLIMADDLAACLGSYGNTVVRTPQLDRLAREGVTFERMYCQYPVCGPSRASMMTGLYPHTTKTLGNRKESFKTTNRALAEHPSLGELLRKQGWFSARVGKIYHMGIPGGVEVGEPGGDDPATWDWVYNVHAPETFSPGKLELLSPKRTHMGSNFARVIVPDGREGTQHDVLAAMQAVALLENRKAVGKPFFLGIGFVRPHVPLVAPARLFANYPAAKMTLPHVPEGDLDDVPVPARAMDNGPRYGMNEEQQRQAIAGYYASVEFMDEQVGKVLEALDRLDLRKNTVVIFTSDHGYSLGEHRMWQKLSLFEESARVPFIVSAPGFERSAGKKTRGVAELIDLYPTVADLLGLAERAPRNLQGRSLRPLLERPERTEWEKPYAFTVTHQQGESLSTPRWRYNRWGAGGKDGEELYDHANDPREFTNLAKDPAHAATLAELRGQADEAKRRAEGR
jgi:arylsulfatase A-like enzyme